MKTSDFDFTLPESLIALRPVEPRDSSRLMAVARSGDREPRRARFRDLPRLLRPGDLLVVNQSRVIPARLIARRKGTGGEVEILLLEELEEGFWAALVRPGKRALRGTRLVVAPGELEGEVIQVGARGERSIRFSGSLPFSEALARFGHTPLPPYILKARQRESGRLELEEAGDRERYQTVYAKGGSSVAAPTAGLHFTPELLRQCQDAGIQFAGLELDVGAGTFLPVEAEDPSEHPIHAERFRVPGETAQAIARAKAEGRRVVAVGTTVVRALETVAGEPGGIRGCESSSRLLILPGHEFRAVDAMITNFHLPRSTLLMLVAAFAGRERILKAYAEAVREGYRFYSYGDAMLVE